MNRVKNNTKRYGLVWEYKEDINQPRLNPTIIEVEELGVNGESSNNYLIEGDNIEFLNSMKNYYNDRVDVIYLDPPYNTGNTSLSYSDNKKSFGEYAHSEWLSFMYDRLYASYDYLKEDGILYVSIDKNLFAHLKLLIDEIYGEENFVTMFVWQRIKNTTGNNSTSKNISINHQHEYILMYAKDKKKMNLTPKYDSDSELKRKGYIYKDEHFEERGYYKLYTLYRKESVSSFKYTSSLDYPITAPNGEVFKIDKNEQEPNKYCYTWSKETFEVGKELDLIVIKKNREGNWQAFRKSYSEVRFDPKSKKLKKLRNYVEHTDYYNETTNNTASKLLYDMQLPFSYSKPQELIQHLVNLHPNKEAVVLDYFSGSGTTGHAVMELNKKDGGNRNFILCSLNEVSDNVLLEYLNTKYKLNIRTIKQLKTFKNKNKELIKLYLDDEELKSKGIVQGIARKRLENVIKGYTKKNGEKVDGIGGDFKYLKIE